jgi:SAM-dependent methyltransferase
MPTELNDFSCFLCNGPVSLVYRDLYDTRFGTDRLYSVYECGSCRCGQLMPSIGIGELKELYRRHYNFPGRGDAAYHRIRSRFLGSFFYRFWLRIDGDISFHLERGVGRLLDVGCNEGRGLRIYRNNGFTVEGLELNERAAAAAAKQGFTVHTTPLEDFSPEERYDVVVLSNVLEHSLDPRDMLARIRRLLKPGGQLWISCPNNRSWLRRLFGKNWIHWHVPFHRFHFSRPSLEGLLAAQGFSVAEVRLRTPALWASHSLIAWLFARRGRATTRLRNPRLLVALMTAFRGLLCPLLWLGNRLGTGDCLAVKAKKTGDS